MTVLAIDTATEYGSVAIRSADSVLAETAIHSREGFSHLIFDAVDQCRREAQVDLKDVDCFAAGAGPGSFTGVRVALAAVKGFAEALGKQAVAVSNLRAISVFGTAANSGRAVLLDARRTEVYSAVYSPDLHVIVPETVGPLACFLQALGDLQAYEFIAPAGTILPVQFTDAPRSLAAAVAYCAEQDLRDGVWFDSAAVDANYVRRSDAEMSWSDSAR